MFRRIAALATALSIATAATAAEVTNFTLDNGLEVVVLEDHRAPVVVHMVWYRVGSADEPRGKSGIAHYLEHLMFKGTDTTGPGEFSDIVAANGGNDNAFTSFDYTGYFQRVAADRLELMMKLEADRMQNLSIAPEFVDSERAVVLEERNQRVENDPGALFQEQRRAAQYLHHPYGIPIIGWKHEIETLTVGDAVSFYEAHYAPNNAILIVAGDVEPDEVRVLAERHYGPIPANPAITPRDRVDEPPQLSERRMVYQDPRVAQPYVARSYLAPERDPGDQREAAALTLLANVLGGSQTTSVLAQKLQLEQKMSIYSDASYRGVSLDDTTFSLFTAPPDGVSLEDAEAALDVAVAEFLEEGVDPEQLDRIKAQIRASEIYDADSVQRLANRYGNALTSGLTLEDIEAWPEVLDSITGDEIIAAARRVFDRRNAVTGWVMPPPIIEGDVSQ
ncbi:M16 family metallopeptidase [Ovoidimarina sediminis]|uniref:M16 family metallopeptidase n=1 Tax=Ovoidimarina sediminis TaxID=3079856 RepID=UPI0029088D93|nr:pitrilysin family protein [Rhodophyticola sp. MJ-SS7]MDU8943837.1 pitrilysin family protein [Rhodophyticola sp. MJ-SS7]